MGEITISVEEYKALVKAQVSNEAFAEFVNSSSYSVSKEECRRYFGPMVKEKVIGEDNQ